MSDKTLFYKLKQVIPSDSLSSQIIFGFIGLALIAFGILDGHHVDVFPIILGSLLLMFCNVFPFIHQRIHLPPDVLHIVSLAPWCNEAKEALKVRISNSSNKPLNLKDLAYVLAIQDKFEALELKKEQDKLAKDSLNRILKS